MKKGRKQPQFLTKIIYQKPNIACFPILAPFPVIAGFSWGQEAPNYSEKFAARPGDARKHVTSFFRTVDMAPLEKAVQIVHKGQDLYSVEEATAAMIAGHEGKEFPLPSQADFVFTRDPGIALFVTVADCWSAVVYATDKRGKSIVGVGHWGRNEQDHKHPTRTIKRLLQEGADPEAIKIGIMPGVKKESYYIRASDQPTLLPHLSNWGSFATQKTVAGEKRLYLDLQGYLLSQLTALIPAGNIQIYDLDTYEEAGFGECFSHRRATSREEKEQSQNGRQIIAAQLISV